MAEGTKLPVDKNTEVEKAVETTVETTSVDKAKENQLAAVTRMKDKAQAELEKAQGEVTKMRAEQEAVAKKELEAKEEYKKLYEETQESLLKTKETAEKWESYEKTQLAEIEAKKEGLGDTEKQILDGLSSIQLKNNYLASLAKKAETKTTYNGHTLKTGQTKAMSPAELKSAFDAFRKKG